ncbi:RNA-binding protein Nova-1 isoform X2 [Thrips palmi]|uniref:RNA-binding protein Nova-1 isoform X2 n=1 Tax=Thrips palmi TaxID=161013 RepID=A0A6P8YFI8_THRPL|nr:RNA-binding protein Nova-1 isoform X2 [Thrips palmi]
MWYAVQSKMAADSGMETCPSPDNPENKKRPWDGNDENGTTKRSHYGAGGSNDGVYHFKILVPSVAAGAIIGIGGETIGQLQKDTKARVKMSKAGDFYPGTAERVCLISGNAESIMEVLTFIMEKIRDRPDFSKATPTHTPVQNDSFDNKISQEREKQVKILVPNSTAGMIIGKGGSYIKQIKEESGSYVQISQKAKDVSLQERCITVIGELDQNQKACLMILQKVMEDSLSGTCLNVSYADIAGPVANFNPRGSPYAITTHTPSQPGTLQSGFNSTTSLNSIASGNALGNGINLSLNLSAPNSATGSALTSQLLEHIKVTLRSSGYSDLATSEIIASMAVLARYGILGMGLGLAGTAPVQHRATGLPAGSYLGVPMDSAPAQVPSLASGRDSGVFGPIGTITGLGPAASTPRTNVKEFGDAGDVGGFDMFLRSPAHSALSTSLNNNSFGLGTSGQSLEHSPTPADPKDGRKVDIEIPELIVGAILGFGGRSLVEIQHLSGASIQISKKGQYAPGTRNRIVTISGMPNAIQTAQYLIEQRVSEEEAKRARQNQIGGLLVN